MLPWWRSGLLQATKVDWIELSKSLVFILFIKSNGLVAPVLFVGWTLNYEMFFYAIFSVGLLLPTRIGALSVIGVLLALTVPRTIRTSNVIGQFYTAPIMLEFGFGMIVGLLYSRISTRSALAPNGFVWRQWLSLPMPSSFYRLLYTCRGLAAMALVTSPSSWSAVTGEFTNRFVLLLGDASYSVYLTHPFVTQTSSASDGRADAPRLRHDGHFRHLCGDHCHGYRGAYLASERPMSKLARQMLCGGRGCRASRYAFDLVAKYVLEGCSPSSRICLVLRGSAHCFINGLDEKVFTTSCDAGDGGGDFGRWLWGVQLSLRCRIRKLEFRLGLGVASQPQLAPCRSVGRWTSIICTAANFSRALRAVIAPARQSMKAGAVACTCRQYARNAMKMCASDPTLVLMEDRANRQVALQGF